MMESKIKIFETGIKDGVMSRNKKFYPDNYTQEQIDNEFLQTRIKVGNKYNLDGRKMFQPYQKGDLRNIDYPDGKYVVLNESHMTKEDFWYEEIPTDILILTNKYKNVVLGNQMADCPILIIEDRKLGVTALSHCGASYIDRCLPIQTVESLMKEYKSNPADLYAYIGSCIRKENYIYDKYPNWAESNEVWDNFITEKDNYYYIDMLGAIKSQLNKMGITNIEVSPYDTVISDKYYSHSAASRGKKDKKGQNFVGFFYK